MVCEEKTLRRDWRSVSSLQATNGRTSILLGPRFPIDVLNGCVPAGYSRRKRFRFPKPAGFADVGIEYVAPSYKLTKCSLHSLRSLLVGERT